MEMVNRILQEKITARIAPNKAVLIFGARRVGKTVMMRKIVENYPRQTMMLNGEDYDTLALLGNRSVANYRHLLEGIDLLAIWQDVGELWENYIIGERRKANFNNGLHKEFYFWRTYDKQEIDLIEESAESLTALEFKWGNKKEEDIRNFCPVPRTAQKIMDRLERTILDNPKDRNQKYRRKR